MSLNHCKVCQKPHYTLLHTDETNSQKNTYPNSPNPPGSTNIASNMHVSISLNVSLMTCQVMVETTNGALKAQALLDTGSSVSFISEHLAQFLHLRHFTQNARICGIAGLPHSDGKQSVTQFLISPINSLGRRLSERVFIVPKVTGDLPTYPITRLKSS